MQEYLAEGALDFLRICGVPACQRVKNGCIGFLRQDVIDTILLGRGCILNKFLLAQDLLFAARLGAQMVLVLP